MLPKRKRKTPLKFAREVEFYLWEVGLCHLQDVSGVGEEDVAAVAVYSHKLVFALFEGSQGFRVVALYPAGFVESEWFPAALCAVFVKQTVLYNFELQLSHGADDFAAVELVDKQLSHAFVHELFHAFIELLGLHGVAVFDVFKHFG